MHAHTWQSSTLPSSGLPERGRLDAQRHHAGVRARGRHRQVRVGVVPGVKFNRVSAAKGLEQSTIASWALLTTSTTEQALKPAAEQTEKLHAKPALLRTNCLHRCSAWRSLLNGDMDQATGEQERARTWSGETGT